MRKNRINLEEPSVYGSILICKVACYSKYMEDMGIVNDVWMTCSIDMNDISCIRNVELEDDENYNGLANIYVRGIDSAFLTNIPFEMALEIFIKYKNNG
jgi:hypothetical protein